MKGVLMGVWPTSQQKKNEKKRNLVEDFRSAAVKTKV